MDIKRINLLLDLARKSIEAIVYKRPLPESKEITEQFQEKRAVFVTLNKDEKLRGCIGQLIARESLWKAVRDMAVSAAFDDPRFTNVTEDELEKISIEISVLSPLKKVDSYKEIRLGTDGVLIRNGIHNGVYLPQVATETGWNIDSFLGSLCVHKAGLDWTAYKDANTDIFVFQVEKFKEE